MELENPLTPTPQMAQRIVANTLGCVCRYAERLPTGLSHYVYKVGTTDNRELAVRIAIPKRRHVLQGGVYWSKKMRPRGVPLPELIAYDTDARNPFMIIEWLPGKDLGDCYQHLSARDKEALAAKIFDIQSLVHKLPKPEGFGYAVSYEDPRLAKNLSWLAFINEQLEEARSSIRKVKFVTSGMWIA
ncbi:MAG: hypothetical protein DHS20C20_28320 [Ardenticatenaceae bacterium]|nr:MAG: hypothetical protein DHS20C20_28320 [Ardenticatenaceae bacterium]